MPVSLYEISVPAFIKALGSLSSILTIGEKYAKENGIAESDITTSRLYPDMLPFTFQIQTACNVSKNACQRVAQITPIPHEDNETTFAQLQERIAKTVAILEGVKPEAFEGREEAEVVLKMQAGDRKFTGSSYLIGFALPNVYFHVSMAYALLRSKGVPIGKGDFLGGKK